MKSDGLCCGNNFSTNKLQVTASECTLHLANCLMFSRKYMYSYQMIIHFSLAGFINFWNGN